jgi:hypothetical protein
MASNSPSETYNIQEVKMVSWTMHKARVAMGDYHEQRNGNTF